MGVRRGFCLLKVLAAVCFAIAVMAGVIDCVVAATQTPLAQSTSCRHPLNNLELPTWRPTELELHRILARHSGWIELEYHIDLQAHDWSTEYLDHVKPAYPDWRREAGRHPEPANLCNADLRGANLIGAFLERADLSGAHLSDANLRGATLSGAILSGANLDGASLSGANLSGANLSGANLSGAYLIGAHLSSAYLNGAHLNGADLRGANLSGANLSVAHLSGANLGGANLSGAYLIDADLSGADLNGANLSGADLSGAHLSGAHLSGAHVNKAKLAYVDLTGATYAPASEPPDPYVARIRGLATLDLAFGEEIGLVQLRKLLQDAGLRDAERAATSSIERSVTRDRFVSPFWSFAWIEGILRFVGFDVTTKYGLHPIYALGWILLLGAVLTPVYMRAMLHPTATSGVVQVFPQDRLDGTAGNPADEEKRKKVVIQAKNWRDAFPSAAYFSLISAVNIGFEQFNPGDWIRRLQFREYSLQAVGWVRFVAGAQALLSVFLLAMWVLTQFGRPFE